MLRVLKKNVTDKEAIDAAFILKSYAKEHTLSNSIFAKIDQQAFYNMSIPSPYVLSEDDKTLLSGLIAIGATGIRTWVNGNVAWFKGYGTSEEDFELPKGTLDILPRVDAEYDIIELLTGKLQIEE